MKNKLILILCLFCFLGIAQDGRNCVTETDFYLNGKIRKTYEVDTVFHQDCGIFQEYDSLGVLLVDGNYEILYSVACKDCYDGVPGLTELEMKASWEKYAYEENRAIRVGLWKYYHANGRLKEIGQYSKKINVTYSCRLTDFDQTKEYMNENKLTNTDSGPINVGISYLDLKDGVWGYFDETGKKIKEEHYVDGTLIYTKE